MSGLSGQQASGLAASRSRSGAFLDGLMRVKRAPWLVIGLWLATVLVALPFAMMLQALIGEHLGASLAAQSAADGVNFDWWNEFLAQTSGIGVSFVPAILGFAAVMKNLSAIADTHAAPDGRRHRGLGAHGGVAVPDRRGDGSSRPRSRHRRRARSSRPAASTRSGSSGWRSSPPRRIGCCSCRITSGCSTGLYPALIENVTLERTAFFYRAGLYALFVAPLLLVNLIIDYAKVRAVVEDRRSMIGAIVAGWRFVRRHPGAAIGLYAVDAVLFLLVIGLYFLAAPGANYNVLAFGVGQLYIVLRVIVRLQFAASQIALFQGRLAHAGYVARPVAQWPDSPAAEALGPGHQ